MPLLALTPDGQDITGLASLSKHFLARSDFSHPISCRLCSAEVTLWFSFTAPPLCGKLLTILKPTFWGDMYNVFIRLKLIYFYALKSFETEEIIQSSFFSSHI